MTRNHPLSLLQTQIRTPDALVWIEVKVESEVRAGQLEGYRLLLGRSGVDRTRLILLTRHPILLEAGAEKPDLVLRWFQVAEWLDQEYRRGGVADPVCHFLCEQLIGFLRARNMTTAQVNWQMAEGIRSLRSLMDMIEEVASFCKLAAKKNVAWDWIGFLLDKKYWVGVLLDEPNSLVFQTSECQINTQAANELGVGAVLEVQETPGGWLWKRLADLDSEDVHFFSRSRPSQIQWLEKFLRESLELARRIEVPESTGTNS